MWYATVRAVNNLVRTLSKLEGELIGSLECYDSDMFASKEPFCELIGMTYVIV
jgi:hypothetical protein